MYLLRSSHLHHFTWIDTIYVVFRVAKKQQHYLLYMIVRVHKPVYTFFDSRTDMTALQQSRSCIASHISTISFGFLSNSRCSRAGEKGAGCLASLIPFTTLHVSFPQAAFLPLLSGMFVAATASDTRFTGLATPSWTGVPFSACDRVLVVRLLTCP
ncbi:hypothetical protein K458DRAFT_142865 [Lentithecium fluviatile CBS 122367]|uniref:Uncharacterized protein n=1 Tax=Lentithecium fluviatile CBS 122367 TaxID=1168545 RepID=A0A6G1IJ05_9PLEO|nr:hypothetical protein K458DRAFT_142865 [Lentithecium fluviatile CBS 122367]